MPPSTTRRHLLWAGQPFLLDWIAPDVALETLDPRDYETGDRNPYFGAMWPAAKGLCEWLVQQGRLDGTSVLDLGCGPGVVGFTAARLGARVTLGDLLPEALDLAAANARRNGVAVDLMQIDLRRPPRDRAFDLVIASDMLYEPWLPPALAAALPAVLAENGRALVSDSMRPPGDRFAALACAAGLAVAEIRRATLWEKRGVLVRIFEVRRGKGGGPA